MRFDFISFLIGFISASVIGYVLYRSRNRISALRRNVETQTDSAQKFVTNSAEGRYRDYVVKAFNQYHLAADQVSLSEVYIEPRFVPAAPPPDPLSDEVNSVYTVVPLIHDFPAAYAPYNVEALTVNDLRIGEKHLALLAQPGMGKSTALAVIGLIAAGEIDLPTINIMEDPFFAEEIKNLPADEREKQQRARQDLQKRALDQLQQLKLQKATSEGKSVAELEPSVDFQKLLPILVHIRDIDLRPEAFGGKRVNLDPAEPLVMALQKQAGGVTSSFLPRAIYPRLTAGTALVMIDGYEALTEEERPAKLVWLKHFIEMYKENFIIVTGPVVGFDGLLGVGLNPVYLRAWSDGDYDELVRRWAAAWGQIAKQGRRPAPLPEEKVIKRVATANRGRIPMDVVLKTWAAFANDEKESGRRGWYDFYTRRLLRAEDARPLVQKAAAAAFNNNGLIGKDALRALFAPAVGADGKPEAKAPSADEQLNKVMASGIFQSHAGDVYAPKYRLLGAFLASETLTAESLPDAAKKPSWALTLPFAAVRLPMDIVLKDRLAAAPDLQYSSLFSLANALLDAPTVNVVWRGEVFRRLAAAMLAPSQYPAIRERAMAAMVSTRDKGVLFIFREAIKQPIAHIRRIGCLGLGALGEPDGIQDLTPLLGDSDPDVQLAAGLALAAVGSDKALETMIDGLLDGEPNLRRAVAEALSALPGVGHSTLRDAIYSPDLGVRRAAVFGLARIKAGWAVALLYKTLMDDSEWYVRQTAEQAFQAAERSEKSGVSLYPDADALSWLQEWAAQKGDGVPAGPAARQVLIRVLQEGEPPMRVAAAQTLSGMGHFNALKPLYNALRDKDESVRAAVYGALLGLQTRTGTNLPALN
jgi:HEAT repeat protein